MIGKGDTGTSFTSVARSGESTERSACLVFGLCNEILNTDKTKFI